MGVLRAPLPACQQRKAGNGIGDTVGGASQRATAGRRRARSEQSICDCPYLYWLTRTTRQANHAAPPSEWGLRVGAAYIQKGVRAKGGAKDPAGEMEELGRGLGLVVNPQKPSCWLGSSEPPGELPPGIGTFLRSPFTPRLWCTVFMEKNDFQRLNFYACGIF